MPALKNHNTMTQKELQANLSETANSLAPAVEHIQKLNGTTDALLFITAVSDVDDEGEPGTHRIITLTGEGSSLSLLIAETLERHPGLAEVFQEGLDMYEAANCQCVACRIERALEEMKNINPQNN